MQSKTSCFKTLYRQVLGRWWPLWLLFVVVPMLTGPTALSSQLRMYDGVQIGISSFAASETYQMLSWAPVLTLCFGFSAAVASFDYLFNTKLTGLMSSIPVKRETVFSAQLLAGATMLVTSALLTAAALLGVQSAYHAVDLQSVATWFGVYASESLAFYGIAVFCCMLTGHVLVSVPLYLLVNFAGTMLFILLQGLYTTFCFGAASGLTSAEWLHSLSPCVRLLMMNRYNWAGDGLVAAFTGWTTVLGYLAVGVVLMVCALLLYRRRQMERAQDTVAFPVLRPVLKYIVTFFAAMGVPFVVLLFSGSSSFLLHLVFTVVGAILGYFISEMIIHKSLRVFQPKKWIGVAAAAAICMLAVCAFRFDWLGYAVYTPQVSQVQEATIHTAGETYHATSAEGIEAVEQLHRMAIDAYQAGVISNDNNYLDRFTFFLRIDYQLRDGRHIARAYYLPEAFADQTATALNTDPLRSAWERLNPPIPVSIDTIADAQVYYHAAEDDDSALNLTKAEALDLYENGIRPDLEAGRFGLVQVTYDQEFYDAQYMANIEMHLYLNDEQEGEQHEFLSYTPNANTVQTNEWLIAHGVTLIESGSAAYG